MSDFVTKSELLSRLINAKTQVDTALSKLTDAQCTLPKTIGVWSVKDLLAHFIAHEQRALEELRCAQRDERPDVPMSDNDAFNLGAVFVSRSQPFEQMKLAWDRSFDEIISTVHSLSEADFESASKISELLEDSIDGTLANNSYEHYADHLRELQALIAKLGIS